MYIDDISSQMQVFLYSVGFGFVLGVLYDIFKITNRFIFKTNKSVFICDICYFVFAAFITFMYLLVINNGKFRLHIFVAFLLGFGIYFFTLSRFVFGFSVYAAEKIRSFFKAAGRMISTPLVVSVSIFRRFSKKRAKNSKKIEKKSEINQNSS